MIQIDGDYGEGGGQVLRSALALSLVTGQGFHLARLRAVRARPGLAPQHLAALLAAAELGRAEVEGAVLGATELVFKPGCPARAGEHEIDIGRLAGTGSAGAVTLVLQALLPPLALAAGPSTVRVRGGTFVAGSPPAQYLAWVLLPTLHRMGLDACLDQGDWGWYPRGGGAVTLSLAGGASLRGLDLTDRGRLAGLRGLAAASNLPEHIPERMAGRLNQRLREAGLAGRVRPLAAAGPATGAGVVLALAYERAYAGFSALGERGKPSERVADEAADRALAFHRQPAALDPHLPDQLLPFLALAEGPSVLGTQYISRHLLTNRYVVERFLDRSIHIVGGEGEAGLVRVR